MKHVTRPVMRRLRHGSVCAALFALAACKTPPAVEPATAPAASAAVVQAAPQSSPAPSPTAPPARPTLAEEQRRLSALFRGTPVVYAMQSDGTLRVDVPLRFCFDPGMATVKPALVAVLDRIAQSQLDGASRITVSVAADKAVKPKPAAAAASATQAAKGKAMSDPLQAHRAANVRDRLAAHGIAAPRLALGGSSSPGVTLLVKESPTP